ncbi:Polysaccharide biosynthesis/export protein [Polystyrenella longa]|uniref:Polysaccharide biosynthesis/export protein n=1 Tax=Polystyrenella longa TaxID=2528007 RepID=A0A518CNS8_9PLAN|nr:polysaccharide biosynthesis/export family protein [Polystyrenella longa]QDU80877.1 Polysaccharide biosynthesis/export protein [Polystyrenella longa]
MTEQRMATWPRQLGLTLAITLVAFASGCVHKGAIPVRQIPPQLREEPLNNEVPIDFTLLRQTPPKRHILDSGDVVGVVIKSILGKENDATVVLPPNELQPNASAGRPYTISDEGTISLPMVGDLNIGNMTIAEANRALATAYFENGLLNENNAEIELRLVQARKIQVHVMREDSDSSLPLAIRSDQQFYVKRGSSMIVELDVYQNDVLHALQESGGLPGIDAKNEVWIIRGKDLTTIESSQYVQRLSERNAFGGSDPSDLERRVTRIPLSMSPNQDLNLSEEDIILNDGDILFIGKRDTDFFITGGLIDGARVPLPRDYDVDVLTALAMANGNPLGPAAGARSNNFQLGPGNILPPTRLIIVRQLPSGDQIKILVNLKHAVEDEHERIKVLPGDLLILEYTKSELFLNVMLNLINLNLSLDQI